MPLRRTEFSHSRRPPAMATGPEWVGGRVRFPALVGEGPAAFSPDLVLWVERPDDIVIGFAVPGPDDPPFPVARVLSEAMERPLVGRPRRPGRVRIADPDDAAELRAFFGDRLDVVVAPTPELDTVVTTMAEDLARRGPEASYFDEGVAPEAVARLFASAIELYQTAPWELLGEEEAVRVDIPSLKVEGACVSVIGEMGETRGMLLFPSVEGFEAFLAVARQQRDPEAPLDLGTSVLSLTFEPATDLPAGMRREASKHGWPVAAPDAYPRVEYRASNGVPGPPTLQDVVLVRLCASTLAAFIHRHEDRLDHGLSVKASEWYLTDSGPVVGLTSPYYAPSACGGEREGPKLGLRLTPEPPTGPHRTPGRNDPCPCGSGKKYKKCHYEADQAARRPEGTAAVHETDEHLVRRLVRYAREKFGERWLRATAAFADAQRAAQLFAPWSVYHFPVDGRPVVDWFVAERGRNLSAEERSWLAAQREAWLTVWEVTDVMPGTGLTVEDLLTGETRSVHEVLGSRQLVPRDAVLGRVVDHGGISVFAGIHPQPLPPLEAAEVVRRVRGRLRRKGKVPIERLRGEAVERYLITRWEDEASSLVERMSRPPKLQNTDGEELLLTTDHFAFDPERRTELESRLSALGDVEVPEPGVRDDPYRFVRTGGPLGGPEGTTLIGTVWFAESGLRLETNSVARADRLRARLEAAGAGLLRHRAREHSSPFALPGARRAATRDPEPPEEVSRAVKELLDRHYADWPDHPLPALGGLTPRQAVRGREGRERVLALIKSFEHRAGAGRGLASQVPDTARLRRELGLES